MAVDLGDLYRCTYTLTSPGGGLVSSTTMTLTITLPDATTTVITPITAVSTGLYQYDYQTVQAGRHQARWVGTGSNPGAHVEVFDVRDSTVPYIISLADAKQALNMTSTVDDEELRTFVGAGSLVVSRLRGEAVIRQTLVEEHRCNGRAALNCPPVLSLTSVVAMDGTYTWTVADLHVSPSGVVKPKRGLGLFGDVIFTYVAGYTVIPEDITQATRQIVQHLWETQRGTRGATRPGGTDGTVMVAGYSIPNRVVELLGAGTGGFA